MVSIATLACLPKLFFFSLACEKRSFSLSLSLRPVASTQRRLVRLLALPTACCLRLWWWCCAWPLTVTSGKQAHMCYIRDLSKILYRAVKKIKWGFLTFGEGRGRVYPPTAHVFFPTLPDPSVTNLWEEGGGNLISPPLPADCAALGSSPPASCGLHCPPPR